MASDGHRFEPTASSNSEFSGVAKPLSADVARLMPGSGIQFIDFEIPPAPLALNFGRYVEEDDAERGPVLIPLQQRLDHDGFDWHPVTNRSLAADEALWLAGYNSLEPFLDVWVPLPYLCVLGGPIGAAASFDIGSANWARLFIERPAPDLRDAPLLRAVIAFDTSLDARGRLDQEPYLAPKVDDVRLAAEFRLAESWVDGWLTQCLTAHRSRLAGNAQAQAESPATSASLALARVRAPAPLHREPETTPPMIASGVARPLAVTWTEAFGVLVDSNLVAARLAGGRETNPELARLLAQVPVDIVEAES